MNTSETKLLFIGPLEARVGQDVAVQVAAAPDVPINAIEGDIRFDPALIAFSDRFDSGIVTLWVEPPHLTAPGVVHYAGIIPGGAGLANATTANLFSLHFTATKDGMANIEFFNTHSYANQADGAEVPVTASDISLNIYQGTFSNSSDALILDYYPPDSFKLNIASFPDGSHSRSALIFQAIDKGSGVASYTMKSKFLGIFPSERVVKSPEYLSMRDLLSIIEVSAVDRTGNTRLASITPQPLNTFAIVGTIAALIISLVLIIKYIHAKVHSVR